MCTVTIAAHNSLSQETIEQRDEELFCSNPCHCTNQLRLDVANMHVVLAFTTRVYGKHSCLRDGDQDLDDTARQTIGLLLRRADRDQCPDQLLRRDTLRTFGNCK